jgi:hypothetical protein
MNCVYIEPTQFVDLRTGEKHYGWRAWDDHGQVYDNTWGKQDIPKSDLEFLKKVFESNQDEALWEMLEFCEQNDVGIFVGDSYHDWCSVAPLLNAIRAAT